MLGRAELIWLLLLVPVAWGGLAWLWKRRLDALSRWANERLWGRLGLQLSRSRVRWTVVLLIVATLGLVGALLEPRWGSVEETVEREGVDIVFVLDSSLSMAADDVKPDRMTVAQTLIRELAHSLPGHRVALVQAEGEGQVLAPLTVDSAVLDLLLDAVLPASLPTPGTLLKPALERAVRLFPEDNDKHRAIVLLSDGEDHSGKEQEVLDVVSNAQAVVYSIGVGSKDGSPIRLPGTDTYKQDKDGRVVVSRLNEDFLEQLANDTGGQYLRAGGPSLDTAPLLAAINSMERRSIDGHVLNTLAHRFQWPLALAAFGLGLTLILPTTRSSKENPS